MRFGDRLAQTLKVCNIIEIARAHVAAIRTKKNKPWFWDGVGADKPDKVHRSENTQRVLPNKSINLRTDERHCVCFAEAHCVRLGYANQSGRACVLVPGGPRWRWGCP